MMGVQRTSVNGIAARMQENGLISYHRGKVTIQNIDLLHEHACECPQAVREHYVEMFGVTDPPERFSYRPRDCRTDA
jgi:Mn-dependent DtxR family transcriptional regulator